MSELTARVITAVVGVPVILFLAFYTPTVGVPLLIAAAAGVASFEYASMALEYEALLPKTLAGVGGLLTTSTLFFFRDLFFVTLVGVVVAAYLVFLFFYAERDRVSNQISSTITGVVYGALPLACLGLLVRHAGETAPFWFILTLATVWLSDTGAYFGGKALGERPLYKAVSPNKSIEGSISGLIGSFVGAVTCNLTFPLISAAWVSLTVPELVALVIPANILAQLGDLSESLIKRSQGVKDSGSIVYGHGGLLDRIDGLMFAAPWFYVFYLVSHGGWL